MVSVNSAAEVVVRRRRTAAARNGSLIVEAVIATALLATATFALAKLARSASELSQQSDQRLAATLAAENTLERLRVLSVAEIQDQADTIGESVAAASGCEVEVETTLLQDPGPIGIHIRVTAGVSDYTVVTLHDWRIEDGASEAE